MKLDFKISDLACAACAETVTKAVLAVDSKAQVIADPKTKQVSIVTEASEDEVKGAISSAGYTVA